MSTQIAVKIPEEMLEAVDQLVATGRFTSRSEAVRAGLALAVRQAKRETIDRAFTDGFRRNPDRPEELADAQRLAIEAIKEEPWKPWW
jgi:Arc/MetJ-type ribon-helix-helix transcriptional regulator